MGKFKNFIHRNVYPNQIRWADHIGESLVCSPLEESTKSVSNEPDLIREDAEETFRCLSKTIQGQLNNGLVEEPSSLLNDYVNLYDALQGR